MGSSPRSCLPSTSQKASPWPQRCRTHSACWSVSVLSKTLLSRGMSPVSAHRSPSIPAGTARAPACPLFAHANTGGITRDALLLSVTTLRDVRRIPLCPFTDVSALFQRLQGMPSFGNLSSRCSTGAHLWVPHPLQSVTRRAPATLVGVSLRAHPAFLRAGFQKHFQLGRRERNVWTWPMMPDGFRMISQVHTVSGKYLKTTVPPILADICYY